MADHDGKELSPGGSIDRRGLLKCMTWAGTGLLWTVSGEGIGVNGIGRDRRWVHAACAVVALISVVSAPHNIALAGEQPNLLVVGEDADQDTVPRGSRIFNRVLAALTSDTVTRRESPDCATFPDTSVPTLSARPMLSGATVVRR